VPETSAAAAPTAPGGLLDAVTRGWDRVDGALFATFAGACVIYVAAVFYGSMHAQTGGVWSAPLDDVFIHFDYARATARGYPFQWSEGNGFSSGNTSLTYPFALAFGYWIGFRDLHLMRWAAIVACVSVLGFFLASARLLSMQPAAEGSTPMFDRWSKYLVPPVVLSLGALDWSLFSGMENAWHLGAWGLALVTTVQLCEHAGDPARVRRWGWISGVAGALLFATRPESVICVAAFAVFAALAVRRPLGSRAALATVLRVAIPGALVLLAQTAANRLLTGEWAANGAIAKLALNNPYFTARQKWDEYRHFFEYVIYRNTEHHFSEVWPWGWLVPAVAAVPLVPKRTRAVALLLWVQVIGWLMLVSFNGQVRWQNERYTMPAVAWLFLLAAMGLALLFRPSGSDTPRARAMWAGRSAVALSAMALYAIHQLPNLRDQIWFFGRASRNIRDQHLVAGRLLAQMGAQRVLVGDAGALIYASDRPGLDLIGLGGYHDLPFARAAVHGIGASLELIERMPPKERPDVMALYPSWWGDLPAIFGQRVTEVPVAGNVICGGAEKVIYRADWSSFDRQGRPRTLRPGEVVVDEVDVADLVSEKAHGYAFPRPDAGFVDFRVLEDTSDRTRDLFDAGRLVRQGTREVARVRAPSGGGRLVARTVAPHPAVIAVRLDGRDVGELEVSRDKGWSEPSVDLPPGLRGELELELAVVQGEWTDFHLWLVEDGAPPARPAVSASVSARAETPPR